MLMIALLDILVTEYGGYDGKRARGRDRGRKRDMRIDRHIERLS